MDQRCRNLVPGVVVLGKRRGASAQERGGFPVAGVASGELQAGDDLETLGLRPPLGTPPVGGS